jgi:hypothetical protein
MSGIMTRILRVASIMAVLALASCGAGATKKISLEVSSLSMQYTPSQVRTFLGERNYYRVQFEAHDSGIVVWQKNDSDSAEQHFRLKPNPKIYVKTIVYKREAVIRVWFTEEGASSLSPYAQREYDALLNGIQDRIGATRVKE